MWGYLAGIRGNEPPFSFRSRRKENGRSRSKEKAPWCPAFPLWGKAGRTGVGGSMCHQVRKSSAGCAGLGTKVCVHARIWWLGGILGMVTERLSATSPAAAAWSASEDRSPKNALPQLARTFSIERIGEPTHGAGRGCAALRHGNAPPIFFGCAKENGPCTVQKKNAFRVHNWPLGPIVDGRESVVRCATRSGSLLPGALYRVRGQACVPAFGGVGAGLGWPTKGFYHRPRVFRFATHYLGG